MTMTCPVVLQVHEALLLARNYLVLAQGEPDPVARDAYLTRLETKLNEATGLMQPAVVECMQA